MVVVEPVNTDQRVPDGYHLTFDGGPPLDVNEWWGRSDDFAELVATVQMPLVTLDFGDWMDDLRAPRH
ncbi:hypothetical protein BWI15_12245 [Kribbella sp. ALI-6-A]|uniref:hypothetical protein n=1 Tax=Kribbella sp. ALI-6-A TaxID=1933817 RepID=UPI00097C5ED5|nr:hypothetical protein [Kribbella sp. ALI-6-A]ONI74132.1 hypothetical protein BWI15_12245 [Kribbella sp. ALI-6-A]